MRTLTGNIRYRLHKPFFKKPLLVLQVEVKVEGVLDCCGGRMSELSPHTYWTDATPELLLKNISILNGEVL